MYYSIYFFLANSPKCKTRDFFLFNFFQSNRHGCACCKLLWHDISSKIMKKKILSIHFVCNSSVFGSRLDGSVARKVSLVSLGKCFLVTIKVKTYFEYHYIKNVNVVYKECRICVSFKRVTLSRSIQVIASFLIV